MEKIYKANISGKKSGISFEIDVKTSRISTEKELIQNGKCFIFARNTRSFKFVCN